MPDEADNHLIELAVAAQADAIVTRNLQDAARGELQFPRIAGAISAGLTVGDSLLTTGRTLGNRWVESRLERMCEDLARGMSITAAARQMNVLPPTVLQMFGA